MTLFQTRFVFTSSFSAISLSACGLLGDDGKQDVLEANRQHWQKYEIDNYEFKLDISCFCMAFLYPARVVVRADTINSILDPQTGEPFQDPDTEEMVISTYGGLYKNIDELFDVVEKAIRLNAEHFQVEYDWKLGYPRQIEVDYSTPIADDEVTYMINDFEAE